MQFITPIRVQSEERKKRFYRCAAPRFPTTTAHDCALGGNPHFSGDESPAATFADFGFWEQALSTEELQHLVRPEQK